MKIYALLLFFSVGMVTASAQYTPDVDFNDEEIIYLNANSFEKGDERKSIWWSYKPLENEFAATPMAYAVFKDARKERRIATVLSIVGGAAMFTGLLADMGDNQKAGLVLGGTVLNGISIPFSIRSRNLLNRAVTMRNTALTLSSR